jgi:hypothetical protein
MAVAAVAIALLVHTPPWHHVTITRVAGATTATLSYDARRHWSFVSIRNLRLQVVAGGRTVFDHELAPRGSDVAPGLALADVWGNQDREAIVDLAQCGNRCWHTAVVVIATTGRVVTRQMGLQSWTLDGRAFMTRDSRLFCNFSDCASSVTPIQVLQLDTAGKGFRDVSRNWPSVLTADARQLWSDYLQERSSKVYEPLGTLVPYCADEFRLGVRAYCNRVLSAHVKRQLAAWGYR